MNAKGFVEKHGIRIACEYADKNPNFKESQNMDHWKCRLTMKGRQLTVYFSKGYGHKGKEPDVAEVIDCLAGDALTVENAYGFENWASELGYDTDSRKAEKTYKVCQRQAERLKRFLNSHYEYALWEMDRL